MSLHVIVGAGPVGSATALRLAAGGNQVRVITRSGTGPDADRIEKITADATDRGRLSGLAAGAAVLYNCASPPCHRWPQDWPLLAASVLAAAEHTGAVLVTMSNLYGYGPVSPTPSPNETRWPRPGIRTHPRRGVGAGACRAPGRPGPGGRSPGFGFLRAWRASSRARSASAPSPRCCSAGCCPAASTPAPSGQLK